MDVEFNPAAYRCQNKSMADALDAGIRVFDLRYAYDVTNSTLVFWHGTALQSETSTVDDVLFGFYKQLLFNALTSRVARKYFGQTQGALGTLGEARGRITLLRRFDLDLLPISYEAVLPGLHFSPANWTDNVSVAYIEDYYMPLTPSGASAEENIRYKFNATEAHLQMAATTHPDSLFWSFASSTNIPNYMTPELQAVGNGTNTPQGGVNQQLLPVFKAMKGKRLGIVMFDCKTSMRLTRSVLNFLSDLRCSLRDANGPCTNFSQLVTTQLSLFEDHVSWSCRIIVPSLASNLFVAKISIDSPWSFWPSFSKSRVNLLAPPSRLIRRLSVLGPRELVERRSDDIALASAGQGQMAVIDFICR
nr:hypothetical protein CFP56_52387 [Quercus suber]